MSGQTLVFEEVYMTVYTVTKWKYVSKKAQYGMPGKLYPHIFETMYCIKNNNSNANGTGETKNFN